MALIDDINALPTTVGDGQTGHLNNHSVIHAALKDHASRITATANGAVRLDTTLGTRAFLGTTMIFGDTGWRDITASAGTAVSMVPGGKINIRRVGHVVYYKITGMKATSAYGQAVAAPAGFRTSATQVSADMSTDQPANARWQVTQYQVAYINGTVDKMLALANEEIIIQVVTDNPWPTTLPGAPA